MGGSASSQLDEGKCAYIRGKTEASIKNFSPYYSRQYSVAFCSHVRSEVEQQRDPTSQFLKTKPPLEPGTVLYEAELSQFAEDIRKWKDRYIVVKNDFAVESYENKEAYQRGAVPKSRILPAGGKVLTSEEEYNLLSDKHFPDPIASSEKNSQPFVVLPKAFPVYLWQPYLRHGYFCFHEATEQQKFSALLNDCIRHLNHDYNILWLVVYTGQLCSSLVSHTLLWSTMLYTGQPCSTLVSHVPHWSAVLYTGQQCSTLVSRALPWSAVLHPGQQCSTLVSHAPPWSAVLHPGQPCSTLVSHAPPWSAVLYTGHPSSYQ